jgi:hypothetical protein
MSSSEQTESPEQLLARALESLSSEERQRVTAWLLARTRTGVYTGWHERSELLRALPSGPVSFPELYRALSGGGLSVGQGHQVVPVRLPADLHGRLRRWSSEHGFSMATVVRGLVSRFLDSQEPEPAAEPEV